MSKRVSNKGRVRKTPARSEAKVSKHTAKYCATRAYKRKFK